MSWAAKRETTRPEDIAYCLLGIFGINMPLLYGEGTRAFLRLQEEIIRYYDDQSLFAWRHRSPSGARYNSPTGILTNSPTAFAECSNIVSCRVDTRNAVYSITNRGLHITVPIFEDYALLRCQTQHDPTSMVVVRLKHLYDNVYARSADECTGLVDQRAWYQWQLTTVYIITNPAACGKESLGCSFVIRSLPNGFNIEKPRLFNTVSGRSQFPIRKLLPGDTDTVKQTLLSRNSGRVRLVLTARKAYTERPGRDAVWTSYELVPQTPSNNRGESRDLDQGSKFLKLVDGRLLHARITQQDIFGERVLVVDVLCAASLGRIGGLWMRMRDILQHGPYRSLECMIECLPLLSRPSWVVVSTFVAQPLTHLLSISTMFIDRIPRDLARKGLAWAVELHEYLLGLLMTRPVEYLPVIFMLGHSILTDLYVYLKWYRMFKPWYDDKNGAIRYPSLTVTPTIMVVLCLTLYINLLRCI